jgi:putative transposase
MNRTTRLLLVDRADAELPIVAQCRLLKVARSSLYWRPAVVSDDDLRLMRQIDELYLATPFYGARRMVAVLRRDGWTVNSKRVRLMRIEAIYQAPDTSRRHPQHIVYSYLLRGFAIERPNQVWCADITYIPMGERLCLSGRGDGLVQPSCSGVCRLAWRPHSVSRPCRRRWLNYGPPEVFNTDQGAQFTSADFTGVLTASGIRISMDGKGRYLDNIFIERL